MRKLPLLTLMLLVAAIGPGAAAASAASNSYDLSLGDSLAAGYQKDATGSVVYSKSDYTHLLFKRAAKSTKHLKLVALGCPGEDTTTFQAGGCPSPRTPADKTSQLKRAVKFLKQHKGQVKFVTVAIGANNFTKCTPGGAVDLTCVSKGQAALKKDLPVIFRALRKAAGKKTKIAELALYNPYLQFYLRGESYRSLALAADGLLQGVNKDIRAAAKPSKILVADGYKAFDSGDLSTTTLFNGQTVPTAVAKVCTFTQMCLPAPQGNIHPTNAGYQALYTAFRKALKL
jgi:lysophospholipase L1-like esterase